MTGPLLIGVSGGGGVAAGPAEGRPSGAGAALAGHPLTAQRPALLLGRPTPDAAVLVGHQRVLEALGLDVAGAAHGLGALDLLDGRAGGADREEEVGVGVATGAVVTPVIALDGQGQTAALRQGHGTSTAVYGSPRM